MPNLEEVLALALALTPQDRLELIALVEDSVEEQAENILPEHWGQKLHRLLENLTPVDMAHPEIEDATEWVRQIRKEQSERLSV